MQPIVDLGYIIKSLVSTEFILHFAGFYDLRILCDRREDFLNLVKLRYAHLKPDTTLKIYGLVFKSLI